jgi:leucyl-tRNA synthetase
MVHKKLIKECLEKVVLLISPVCPHLAEELWQELGNKTFISCERFPEYEEAWLIDETYTLVVQVNGKVRDQVEVSVEATKEELEAMIKERPKVKKYLEGKTIKNVVFVPKKLINFVV